MCSINASSVTRADTRGGGSRVRRGVMLVELLIVVAIIALIGASSIPYLGRFLAAGYLTTTTAKVVRTLRKAQIYSINGKRGSAWGVHCEPARLVLFKGDNYATRDPSFDEELVFPQSVEVAGLADIYFQKQWGTPSETITVTVSALNDQRTVTVNPEGMVDVQ